jgi:hypothetical protein
MKLEQNLLCVHLNEFNYEYLKKGAKKYKCKNIERLLKLKKISTFTNDKQQNKNLDPWVQSVSINTGIKSTKHKIFNLGQKIDPKFIQIWDVLSQKKISCSVWGTMNSKLNYNKNIDLYFPDPWNYNDAPYPKNLQSLYLLPNYYAKNYLDFSILRIIYLALIFFVGCLKNNQLIFFLKKTLFFSKIIYKIGIKNFLLFFVLDLVSINILYERLKIKKSQFSMIFLNSLAHFQHNNWDENENEKYYFMLTEEIFKKILEIKKLYRSIIIFNGFTQKKIEAEFLLRPKNPSVFLKNLNINFINLEQDMTNGGFLYFSNTAEIEKAINILSNFNLFGMKLFYVKKYPNNSLFYKIQIKSLVKLNLDKIKKINGGNIRKNLAFYDKKLKFNYTDAVDDGVLKTFIENIEHIKCTGIHINTGVIIYENLKKNKLILKNKIENHKIFNLIENHFK